MSYIPKLRFPEFKGEWEEKRLDSLSLINPKPGDLPEVFSYIDLESVKNGVLLQEKIIKKEEAPSRAQRLLEEKDILFQTVRPYQRNNYFFNSKSPTVASTGYAQFRVNKNNYPSFLYQYLYTNNFVKNVLDRCSGTSFPAISTNDLLEICLHIPSLAEQQKIADFLSNVDSIITAETKILNTLQKKKKALMQKLFTRQLRFKSDDGTDFPAWEEKKLREISSSPKYGLNASGIDYDGEHKYLRITDIDEVTHTFSPEEITTPSEFSDEYLLEENDIVFARTGASTGKTYLYNPNDGDLYFAGFLIKFHIKDANARFVFYQTCTHEYEKWVHVMSTRSGQPGINSEEYSTLKIKLPCIEEQQKIADCLSSMDSLIQNQQKVVTTWQQRKKALLQQMFI